LDWNWFNLRGGKEEKESNRQFGKLCCPGDFICPHMMNPLPLPIAR